jgi:ATP-dependent helicase/nuclease subunit A
LLYISGSQPQKGDKLSWYGDIARQYGLNPLALESPQILESSNSPPDIQIKPPASSVEKICIDARLSRPLQVAESYHEIAPSRQLSSQQATGAVADEDGRLRGILIHRMLEMLTNEAAATPVTIPDQLGVQIEPAELEKCWEEAKRVWQHPRLQHLFDAAHFRQAFNEVPLLYQQQNATVHGIIDRLVVTDTEALVIDYKTHRHAKEDNLAQIAAPYFTQLGYYREGIQRVWPTLSVRALLVFTACAGVVELPV